MRLQSLEQSVAVLDAMAKHWRLQVENSERRGRHYSCTVWARGRRFTTRARTPVLAVNSAIDKIRGGVSGTRLKIVRCADGN